MHFCRKEDKGKKGQKEAKTLAAQTFLTKKGRRSEIIPKNESRKYLMHIA